MKSTSVGHIIQALPCWEGPIHVVRKLCGLTNVNYLVEHQSHQYIVRLGGDIAEHYVNRNLEHKASVAAAAAGIAPLVIYFDENALVREFISGRALSHRNVSARVNEVGFLIRKAHESVAEKLADANPSTSAFDVFAILDGYLNELEQSNRMFDIEERRQQVFALKVHTGNHRIVFAHNDLLPSNLIDDGRRLWLIDWDYAGFGDPMFDLGGLANNSALSSEKEIHLLKAYGLDEQEQTRFTVAKATAALREELWARVSALHPRTRPSYQSYIDSCSVRFSNIWETLKHSIET